MCVGKVALRAYVRDVCVYVCECVFSGVHNIIPYFLTLLGLLGIMKLTFILQSLKVWCHALSPSFLSLQLWCRKVLHTVILL